MQIALVHMKIMKTKVRLIGELRVRKRVSRERIKNFD